MNNRITQSATVMFIGLIMLLGQVQAASFDCGKAAIRVEKMICSNDELSRFDEQMADLYQQAIKLVPNTLALKEEQRAWIRMRNRCRPEDIKIDPPMYADKRLDAEQCLHKIYSDRIRQLKARYFTEIPDPVEIVKQGKIHKSLPLCERFQAAAQSGEGFEVIPPVVEDVPFNSPLLEPYLGKCDYLQRIRYSTVEVPRYSEGERYMYDTGRAYAKYNNYSLWVIHAESGATQMFAHLGADYYDLSRSDDYGVMPSFWSSGADVTRIEPSTCGGGGWATERYASSDRNAPPYERQSEIIKFDNQFYVIATGRYSSSRLVVFLYEIEKEDFKLQCKYLNKIN